jgi:Holliday junction resolvase
MNNYERGRNFEYRVKRYFESKGFKVFRCASSKPIDLIAIKRGEVILIECKINYCSPSAKEHIRELAEELGTDYIIAVRKGRKMLFWK